MASSPMPMGGGVDQQFVACPPGWDCVERRKSRVVNRMRIRRRDHLCVAWSLRRGLASGDGDPERSIGCASGSVTTVAWRGHSDGTCVGRRIAEWSSGHVITLCTLLTLANRRGDALRAPSLLGSDSCTSAWLRDDAVSTSSRARVRSCRLGVVRRGQMSHNCAFTQSPCGRPSWTLRLIRRRRAKRRTRIAVT